MSDQMSPAVADLLLRCLVALADKGIGPKSYSSVTGPDSLPGDAGLFGAAADIVGREKIFDFLLDGLKLTPQSPAADRWDVQARQFAELFPGYCSDGTCGHCGACELRKDGG